MKASHVRKRETKGGRPVAGGGDGSEPRQIGRFRGSTGSNRLQSLQGGSLRRPAGGKSKQVTSEIRAVLFDLDGVLVYTNRFHTEAWQRLAKEQGWSFPSTWDEGTKRQEALERLLRYNRVTLSEKQKEQLADQKNEWFLDRLRTIGPRDLVPGVVDFLRQLRAKGIKLACCSSSENAEEVAKRLHLTDFFPVIISGKDVTRGKPDPEIFQLGAERLGVGSENCLVFEDAHSGQEAAECAHMPCVGIGRVLLESPKVVAAFLDFDHLTVDEVFAQVARATYRTRVVRTVDSVEVIDQMKEPKQPFSVWLAGVRQRIDMHDPADAIAAEVARVLRLLASFAMTASPDLPSAIPDEQYARETIVLAAGYDLSPHSGSGYANDVISDQFTGFCLPAIHNRWSVICGAQWEHHASILERGHITSEVKDWFDSRVIVAAPPSVKPEDIAEADVSAVAGQITAADDDSPVGIVRASFPSVVLKEIAAPKSADNLKNAIVVGLNAFLHIGNAHHYQRLRIHGVQLVDFDRGVLGRETRQFPPQSVSWVSRYRAMRLNRLALERVFEGKVKAGSYLSTATLVSDVFDQVARRSANRPEELRFVPPRRCVVFAQADHAGRVVEIVRQEIETRSWDTQVMVGVCPRTYSLDGSQSWCQRPDEFVVRELIARLKLLLQQFEQKQQAQPAAPKGGKSTG